MIPIDTSVYSVLQKEKLLKCLTFERTTNITKSLQLNQLRTKYFVNLIKIMADFTILIFLDILYLILIRFVSTIENVGKLCFEQ